jgi:hypothetical protein
VGFVVGCAVVSPEAEAEAEADSCPGLPVLELASLSLVPPSGVPPPVLPALSNEHPVHDSKHAVATLAYRPTPTPFTVRAIDDLRQRTRRIIPLPRRGSLP